MNNKLKITILFLLSTINLCAFDYTETKEDMSKEIQENRFPTTQELYACFATNVQPVLSNVWETIKTVAKNDIKPAMNDIWILVKITAYNTEKNIHFYIKRKVQKELSIMLVEKIAKKHKALDEAMQTYGENSPEVQSIKKELIKTANKAQNIINLSK